MCKMITATPERLHAEMRTSAVPLRLHASTHAAGMTPASCRPRMTHTPQEREEEGMGANKPPTAQMPLLFHMTQTPVPAPPPCRRRRAGRRPPMLARHKCRSHLRRLGQATGSGSQRRDDSAGNETLRRRGTQIEVGFIINCLRGEQTATEVPSR